MATIDINESTHRRITSLMKDMAHSKGRNMDYDDVINELIDVYQDNSWISGGAGAGGG